MSPAPNEVLPPMAEFYRGRTILITGGSGFMGKVLVEKLLRSCPMLDTIYLLLRAKKGKLPVSRLQDITKDVLFDTLRLTTPAVFEKLKVVAGDVTECGLGLSASDRETLQNEVEIVFHSAASVRFDDPLPETILINVRGPKEMIDLALGMKKLMVFLHVSTAFCNIDKDHLHERVHPVAGDWRTMLKLADNPDVATALHCLKSKILGGLPNAYTYTKALGEQVINDYKDRLPLVIVRPSIVLPPKFQSTIGWLDNVNGPVAYWLVGYVGLISGIHLNPEVRLDYIPVDQAINSFIFIACHRALTVCSKGDLLPVYNCCKLMNSGTERELIKRGIAAYQRYPTLKAIRYPDLCGVPSRPCFTAQIILFHLIPYFFLDLFTRLGGEKPLLVKFLRRTYTSNLSLSTFTTRQTNFTNTAFMALEKRMAASDHEHFWFAKVTSLESTYIVKTLMFLRVHLLKDPLDTMPEARRRLQRLFWLKIAVTVSSYLAAIWLVYTSCLSQWILSVGSSLRYQLLEDWVQVS